MARALWQHASVVITRVMDPEIGNSNSRLPLRATDAITPLAVLALTVALVLPAACAMGARGEAVSTKIAGQASVNDGDGLYVDGTVIRLFGIDAPEVGQYCKRPDGSKYRCGQYATVALDRLVQGHRVVCEVKTHDRYHRSISVCRAGGKDLGEEMVAAGWAVAYRHYSDDYVAAEDRAHRSKAGIWSSRFEMPWDWRRTHRKEQH